jgi:lipoprotein-releasing system ATP-binding protein
MSQLTQQTLSYKSAAPPEVIVSAQGVCRSFRMGRSDINVLQGVDLSIRRGEFIAIEGRSGSGKSTLLHILGALDAVDKGSVAFEGRDYTRFRSSSGRWLREFLLGKSRIWLFWIPLAILLADGFFYVLAAHDDPKLAGIAMWTAAVGGLIVLRWLLWAVYQAMRLVSWLRNYSAERQVAQLRNKEFGFVFQFYHLLPELTVLENTLLSPMVEKSWLGFRAQRRTLVKRAEELLQSLGVGHRMKHLPSELSGGERQRVAIARALMNNPRVLFADEPTGNLDDQTGRQIMGVLEKLHREQGQTIVMVTHDRSLARFADRTLILQEGRLQKAANVES